MIYVTVPKEIKEYEKKVVGSISLRQCICLIIGTLLSIFLCVLLIPILGESIVGYIIMGIVIPCFLVGFIKFQDFIPGEVYAKLLLSHYQHKQRVVYNNEIEYIRKDNANAKKKKRRKKKIKETIS